MKTIAFCYRFFASITLLLCLLVASPSKASYIVAPGFDLFSTVTPGTSSGGFEFEGVPFGGFDFGSGLVSTGNADTIVHRLGQADGVMAGGSDTIDIELVALQLRTVDPVDMGAGLGFYYATLGAPSTGEMTIVFDDMNGGTFGTSSFDVFFDIRFGALDGTIVTSGQINLDSSGNRWGRTPPPGAVIIPGINYLLNGQNTDEDFWTVGVVNHTGPHPVITAVPGPATIALLGLGLVGLVFARRWKV